MKGIRNRGKYDPAVREEFERLEMRIRQIEAQIAEILAILETL